MLEKTVLMTGLRHLLEACPGSPGPSPVLPSRWEPSCICVAASTMSLERHEGPWKSVWVLRISDPSAEGRSDGFCREECDPDSTGGVGGSSSGHVRAVPLGPCGGSQIEGPSRRAMRLASTPSVPHVSTCGLSHLQHTHMHGLPVSSTLHQCGAFVTGSELVSIR